jgi:hypothetical protein
MWSEATRWLRGTLPSKLCGVDLLASPGTTPAEYA